MDSNTIKSPNGNIEVHFSLTSEDEQVYNISYTGSVILQQSKLGIMRRDADVSTKLTLESALEVNMISDNYTLLYGKRLYCNYSGNKRTFYLKNANLNTFHFWM